MTGAFLISEVFAEGKNGELLSRHSVCGIFIKR